MNRINKNIVAVINSLPEEKWIELLSMLPKHTPIISEYTNSEIGSIHWRNTILANALHIGEYLKEKGIDGIGSDTLKQWGKDLFDRTQEMITHYDIVDKIEAL